MSAPTTHYDVFISYSPADRDWVASVLLPRLEAAGLQVAVDYRDFVVGKPRIENIEAAVDASRRTIVVLSPDWVASEWNAFEALLVRSEDPSAARRRLLPLRLRPCDLPAGLARLKLDVADLTAARYKEAQLKRLVRDVADVVPAPLPGTLRDWGAWRRWLRRYRRQVRWAAAALLFAALLLAMSLQRAPFQPRPVWVNIAGPFSGAWKLHYTGEALIVGAENDAAGCEQQENGIWYQAAAGRFAPSTVSTSLCVEKWKGKGLSAISGVASGPEQPQTVYILTSHSGVLVSGDGGASFTLAAPPPPPSQEAQGAQLLGVQFRDPVTLWASGRDYGLWRYRLGAWTRMDGAAAGACAGLPQAQVSALLVHGERVLIGSDQAGLWVTEDGGLTCRGVFDAEPPGQYEFLDLAPLDPPPSTRYLALAWDHMSGAARPGQLFVLCARPGLCTAETWQADAALWQTGAAAERVMASAGQWYVAEAVPFGRVWRGNLAAPVNAVALSRIWRCFGPGCRVDLAAAAAGQPPYLLAAGRIYRFEVGPWWRSAWP